MKLWAIRSGTVIAVLTFLAGCASMPPAASEEAQYRELALRYVRAAMTFTDNAAVRAQAMEAAPLAWNELRPMVIEGLRDPHPGVRFAACMALGKRRDTGAATAVRPLLHDADHSVRVGAYFAVERLGDSSHRTAWAEALLRSKDPSVRRNAALAMGQLEDAGVMPLLQRASREDKDEGVRLQSLEAMALLGDQNAASYFIRDAYGGAGYRQPFAILTLGHVKEDVVPLLRSRLKSSPYIEAQLAAARSLGVRGNGEGYELALHSLTWNSPQKDLPDDPPDNQLMRVRSMAALALGEIKDRRALPALRALVQGADDSRVQLAAARAMLMIVAERRAVMSEPGQR